MGHQKQQRPVIAIKVTEKYYKDMVFKKLKKYYKKWCPVMDFKHVRLLHYNTPAHVSAIVTNFLQREVLPHPHYSPDHALCEFFTFPKLKTFLDWSRQGHNCVVNLRKLTCNNPNLDLVRVNAYAKFNQIPSICSQDIERNQNSDNSQGP